MAAVYVSLLRRAVATAAPIAAKHGLEVVTAGGLADLDHGRWEELIPAEAEAMDRDGSAVWGSTAR